MRSNYPIGIPIIHKSKNIIKVNYKMELVCRTRHDRNKLHNIIDWGTEKYDSIVCTQKPICAEYRFFSINPLE